MNKFRNFFDHLASLRSDRFKTKRFACRLIQSSIHQFYDSVQNGVNIEYWRQCSSVFENKPTKIRLREEKNINKTHLSPLIIYDFVLKRNFIYLSQNKKKNSIHFNIKHRAVRKHEI